MRRIGTSAGQLFSFSASTSSLTKLRLYAAARKSGMLRDADSISGITPR